MSSPQGTPASGQQCSEAAQSQRGASQIWLRDLWSARPESRADFGQGLRYEPNWVPPNFIRRRLSLAIGPLKQQCQNEGVGMGPDSV